MTQTTYSLVKEHLQKIFDVQASIALLNWDLETYMPKGGAAQRSRQISTLSGIAHELVTDEAFKSKVRYLNEKLDGLSPEESVNIKETFNQIERADKLDTEFVTRRSTLVSETYQAWTKAREEKSFAVYSEQLDKLIQLKKEEADRIGYEGHIYNALLEEFEPGMTSAMVDTIFDGVKKHLQPILKKINEQEKPNDAFLYKYFDKDKQWDFGIDLLKNMGYDFNRGRQDISVHPFSTGFGPDDIRVTTRINENNFSSMVWSCIHEGGHAVYEQGMLPENYGLPMGRYISLGIHESQSRLWENHVGRSKAYWTYHYPKLKEVFSEQFEGISLEEFYAAANKIAPSPIRTEADELHYHFHVLIRFEIEKALLEGSLDTADAEDYWNAKYKEYLGLDITDPNQGILQDIHWSLGSFGYFPTYSIGSFYAAQFHAQAEKEIENLEDKTTSGDHSELLNWLQHKIYKHGMRDTAEDLCRKVTGEGLNYKYFEAYVQKKYGHLYNL